MTDHPQSPLPKHFIWHGPTQQAACVNYLKDYHGKKIQVDIIEYIPERTDSQSGYFHVLCRIFGDAIGETEGDVKMAVKKKLWGTDFHEIGGITVEVFKSMEKGKSNKLDYMDATDTLLRMAAESGVYLPDPE